MMASKRDSEMLVFNFDLLKTQIQRGLAASRWMVDEYPEAFERAWALYEACKRLLEPAPMAWYLALRGGCGHIDWIKDFNGFTLNDEAVSDSPQALLSEQHKRLGTLLVGVEEAACLSERAADMDAICVQYNSFLSAYEGIRAAYDEVYQRAKFYQGALELLRGSGSVRMFAKLKGLFGGDGTFDDGLLSIEPPPLLAPNPLMEGVVKSLVSACSELPQSGGSAFGGSSLRIGLISDDFAYFNYKDYASVIPVNLSNYERILDEGLDALLCISCWCGIEVQGDEVTCLDDFSEDAGRGNIATIFARAKEKNISTIFQSIEDPPSYELFLPIAKEADAVFTSAIECVDEYRRDTDSDNIGQVGFGVNPIVHNPLGMMRRRVRPGSGRNVLFAGAWYQRFSERCADTRMIFDGVLHLDESLFVCIDRNLGAGDPLRTFPLAYGPHLCPPMDYGILQRFHKEFDWAINLNSVTESSTMCAERVYELQALGSLIISNYSRAVANLFPGVFMVFREDEVPRILAGYTEREIVSMQIEGIRDVLSNHSNDMNLARMVGGVGLSMEGQDPCVRIYCDLARGDLLKDVASQTYADYEIVDISELSKRPFASGEYHILWDEVHDNPFYLEDLVNVFKFADVDFACYGMWDDLLDAYEPLLRAQAPRNALMHERALEEGVFSGVQILEPSWGRDTSGCSKEVGVVISFRGDIASFHKRTMRSLLRSSAFAKMNIYVLDMADGGAAEEMSQLRALYRGYDNVRFLLEDERIFDVMSESYVAPFLSDCESVSDGIAELLAAAKGKGATMACGRWEWADKLAVLAREGRGEGAVRSRDGNSEAHGPWDRWMCIVERGSIPDDWDGSLNGLDALVASCDPVWLEKIVGVRY